MGDNDTLSALVAVNVGAELLVILSDVDGLYTADPHTDSTAKRIERVEEITPEILALGGGKGSALGTGGMKTKLRAATICVEKGCDMIIADGQEPDILYKIVDGESVGTRFVAKR